MDLAHLVHAGVVSVRALLARGLRSPALHFAALGAVLFAWLGPEPQDPVQAVQREPIVVGATQVEALLAAYARATGFVPTEDDARMLVAREVDEEILYREALALGLDREDRGIQWRLIEKMTFLADDHGAGDRADLLDAAVDLGLSREDPVVRRILVERMRLALQHAGNAEAPTQEELRAHRDRHRERFVQPARVRMSQVHLARDRRGDALAADAAALLERLRDGSVAPAAARSLGDPFPLVLEATWISQPELAARFGPAFAEAALRVAPGVWSGPVASTFGLHLVLVHERALARLPEVAEIEGPLAYGVVAERRERALAEGLARLRARWEVRVQWPERLPTLARAEAP